MLYNGILLPKLSGRKKVVRTMPSSKKQECLEGGWVLPVSLHDIDVMARSNTVSDSVWFSSWAAT